MLFQLIWLNWVLFFMGPIVLVSACGTGEWGWCETLPNSVPLPRRDKRLTFQVQRFLPDFLGWWIYLEAVAWIKESGRSFWFGDSVGNLVMKLNDWSFNTICIQVTATIRLRLYLRAFDFSFLLKLDLGELASFASRTHEADVAVLSSFFCFGWALCKGVRELKMAILVTPLNEPNRKGRVWIWTWFMMLREMDATGVVV